jgi:hypothetical protein
VHRQVADQLELAGAARVAFFDLKVSVGYFATSKKFGAAQVRVAAARCWS